MKGKETMKKTYIYPSITVSRLTAPTYLVADSQDSNWADAKQRRTFGDEEEDEGLWTTNSTDEFAE